MYEGLYKQESDVSSLSRVLQCVHGFCDSRGVSLVFHQPLLACLAIAFPLQVITRVHGYVIHVRASFRKCIAAQLSFLCGLVKMSSLVIGAFMSSKFGFLAVETWNVMVPCVSLRDVLCLCCAFSAVLSGFGHSLPCEACRENVSHGVIMTNLLPHPKSPFSSSTFFPLSVTMAMQLCLFFPPIPPQSEGRISCFFALLNHDSTGDIQACVTGWNC